MFVPGVVSIDHFESGDIGRLIFVIVLLFVSALISGSETSFFSLSPQNINQLKNTNSTSSNRILKLLSTQDYLLATILIANNLVNICIVIISNAIIDSVLYFGDSVALELITKLGIVTFLLLLFGEIMPKIFASYNPLRMAKIMATPLLVLKYIFKPISFLLIRSSNHINESVAKKRVAISIDEISNAIEMTSNHSVEEKRILSGIADFVNTDVEEIMKPRVDIVALDIESDFLKVKQTIISSGFSRIPVYEESLDNIKGVLYVKDMIPYLNNEADFEWNNLSRKPYFIPEHKKINDLLEEFQTQKIHVAIVVDEYGSTLGLVSLEDILEEIVGEITDESDVELEYYKKIALNTYIFEGKTHVNDLLKVLALDDNYLDEVKGEAETIAGLMLEIRKDFLKQGESLTHNELNLTAELVDGHRIDKVKVLFTPAPTSGS